MSAARDEILAPDQSGARRCAGPRGGRRRAGARDYRRPDARPRAELIALLCERVGDYRAEIRRVAAAEITEAVQSACAELGLTRVAVPPQLPAHWRPETVEVVEDHGLSAAELDGLDGAVTGCATAIAETGTLVLDGQALSGRRLLTLVPDHHICVVRRRAGRRPGARGRSPRSRPPSSSARSR